MSKRNPRIEPAAGDILRWSDRERHVIGVHPHHYPYGLGGKMIRYLDVRKSGSKGSRSCSLESWQKWAARVDIELVQTA